MEFQTNSEKAETQIVTGGGGYAGYHLGCALAKKGYNVKLIDVKLPEQDLPSNVSFIQIDIRDYESLKKALQGGSCIYHLASYGMSGREQLNRKLIVEVNIKGTENVIHACKELGIDRIVYTSTFNVVFGGQVIENGDESLPYYPSDKQPDYYSSTKTIAEQMVLKANGETTGNGNVLRTCALRLAGVYGPGEQRHLPRIVKIIEGGLYQFVYGDPSSRVEFLHRDNLVQAHICAAEALSQSKQFIAAGQAYFISDGKPINNFEFFRPLVEGLGYKCPKLRMPISIIYFIAFITEWVHFIFGRVYNFQPFLTRAEVYKTGVTHWFNLTKAETELGYRPTVQNDLEDCVKWFRKRGHGKSLNRAKSYSMKQLLIDIFLVVAFVGLVMSFLPGVN